MRIKSITMGLIFLGLLVFSFFPGNISTAIQDIQVTVKPRRVAAKASYLIVLQLEKALEVHDWIKVTWPKEAKLPVLPEDSAERNAELKRIIESIYIGTSPCSACQGLPEINYRDNSIKFNIHMELNPAIPGYEKVHITITDRVGVINPPQTGSYKLKISTAKEIEAFSSQSFDIVESQIGVPTGIPEVAPDPAGFFQNASYKIKFRVGLGGQMSFNQSRIRVKFPKAIRFAYDLDKIPYYAISVNGKPNNNRFALSDHMITFITPIDVDNSEEVIILFDKEMGIINPSESGDYFLEVSTSEDPEWVRSEPFQIQKQGSSLRIRPNKTNQRAEIEFIATLPSDLNESNPLLIVFPDQFSLPHMVNPNTISINETIVRNVSVQNKTLIVYPSEPIKQLTSVSIHILKDAEIRNPKEETIIKLLYKASSDLDYLYTDEIAIEPASFEINSLSIEPSNASSKAKYQFSFFIESQEGLVKGDSLWIQFPAGTVLPSDIPTSLVLLYGISPERILIHPDNVIEFVLSYSVRSEEELVLSIERNAGIVNPVQINEKSVFIIQLSKFPKVKKTIQFQFLPPLPNTKLIFSEGRMGKNNWYTEPPILHFTTDQAGVKTYLFWNDESEKAFLYSQPEKLMSGQYIYKLSFYSVGPYGTEEAQSIVIQVDTHPPSFSLRSPIKTENGKTNQKELIWEGETKKETTVHFLETVDSFPDMVRLNNQSGTIDENGHFRMRYATQPGKNHLLFTVEDKAGNQFTETITFEAKFTPPSYKILIPAENSVVTFPSIMIVGETDPHTLVQLNDEIKVEAIDGRFSIPYPLHHFGKQTMKLVFTDEYNNIASTQHVFWFGLSLDMIINQKTVIVNEKKVILATPPFIISGRTFIPFRFLGEQLGASVRYTVDPKTKQVNTISYELEDKQIILFLATKTIAVNGTKYPLEPMPIIKQGTTFVPVRLISEFLDCKVDWIKAEQRVHIEYPNLKLTQ